MDDNLKLLRVTRRSTPDVTLTRQCSPVHNVVISALTNLIMSSKSGHFGSFPSCFIRDELSVSSLGRCGSGTMGNLLSCFIIGSSSEERIGSFQSRFSSRVLGVSRLDQLPVRVSDHPLGIAILLSFKS